MVNGFISASKQRDYWYGMSKVAGGAGDIFVDATKWEPIGDASLSGYERSRVLLGLGGGRFRDVAVAVGADDLYDGRAVAFGDLSNRGRLDVVVANQKGPLLLYENSGDESRHWVQFKLKGTQGNTSAIGAELRLFFAGKQQIQAVQGGSGFCAQNDRRLHFGLGSAATIERAVVRWPSGREQGSPRSRSIAYLIGTRRDADSNRRDERSTISGAARRRTVVEAQAQPPDQRPGTLILVLGQWRFQILDSYWVLVIAGDGGDQRGDPLRTARRVAERARPTSAATRS